MALFLEQEVDLGALFAPVPGEQEMPAAWSGNGHSTRIDLTGAGVSGFAEGGDWLGYAEWMTGGVQRKTTA